MADWIWVESPGARKVNEPRMRQSTFGDGYRQVAPDGINNNPDVWEIPFNDVDDAVANDMDAFLAAAAQTSEPFNYWPLWASGAKKFICLSYSRTQGTTIGTSSFQVRFEQVYVP
jgi:phage-related protein